MDDDNYSEMSEAESDYTESTSKKGKLKAKQENYKIRNALKVPRATTYTAQALYDQILNNDIILDPEYQRDVVWSELKQVGLIDSIFRNFYIPPIIFCVNQAEDGSETRTCIDGKQRLTSIHRFMDGLIPHKDPITHEKLYYKDAGDIGRPKKGVRILPERYRRMFANKQIVCVEYQDITESDEREIFQRVQLGMALTPAEKMQVINGPHAAFVRYIQAKYLKGDGLLASDALEWDKTRGADFRCIAQAFYQMANPNLRGSSIPQLEKFLSQSNPPSADLKHAVEQAFQVLATLVQDKKFGKTIKKAAPKFSPVEFIMTCVAIYHWKDRLSLAACANGVARLRDNARNLHVDIRTNSRVVKTMLDFISSYKPPAAEAGGEAAVHCIDPRILSGAGIESDSEEPGDKRKRSDMAIDSDEQSEEEKPLKKKVASQLKRSRKVSPAAMVPPPSASPVSVQSPLAMEGITPTTSSVPPPPKHDRMVAFREAKAASARSAPPPPASFTSAPPNLPTRRASGNYPQPHLTLSHLPSPPVHAGPGYPSNSPVIPGPGPSRPVPAPNPTHSHQRKDSWPRNGFGGPV